MRVLEAARGDLQLQQEVLSDALHAVGENIDSEQRVDDEQKEEAAE